MNEIPKNEADKDLREVIIKKMLNDTAFRLEVVRKSPFWFAHYYFSKHVELEMADFHKEILELLADNEKKLIGIAGFRNSGKSTLASQIFPIWEVLGIHELKFIVIISETQRQAEQLLDHIRKEMEQNTFLIRDLGPFYTERDEWGRLAIVIKKYNARIMAASLEQSIRGIRFRQFRPQLLVIDDIECLQSVKTPENREKTWNWFQGEILPAGSLDTKIVVLGGILHQDSFLNRLRRSIEERGVKGTFRTYPFMDAQGNITWPAKFTTPESVDEERKKYDSRAAWERELQLNPIQDEEQIIKPEFILRYERLPDFSKFDFAKTFVTIDPASAKTENAHFSAVVAMTAAWDKKNMYFYVHPNPINERLDMTEMKQKAILIAKTIRPGNIAKIIVEDIGSQRWLIQEINKEGVIAEAFSYRGMDKDTKIKILGAHMQEKRVFFPQTGAEELIKQSVEYGVAKYDDLVDALAMGVIMASDYKRPIMPEILSINW